MCEDCNQFWHVNNPIRQSHKVLMIDDCEDSINVAGDINSSSSAPASVHESGFHDFDEPEDEISGSQDLEDMCRVATLAETFELTPFKPFQNTIIDGCLKGKDTIVVQPTGNGKKLMFSISSSIYRKDVSCNHPNYFIDARSNKSAQQKRNCSCISLKCSTR